MAGARADTRGYSLVELVVTLALVGAMITTSLVLAPKVLAHSRANAVIEQIPITLAAVTSATGNMPDISGLTTSHVANARGFPSASLSGDYTDRSVVNPFGGRYWIAGQVTDFGGVRAGNGYFFLITQVPAEVCPAIVSGASPAAHAIAVLPARDDLDAQLTSQAGVVGVWGSAHEIAKAPGAPGIDISNLSLACTMSPSAHIVLHISREG